MLEQRPGATNLRKGVSGKRGYDNWGAKNTFLNNYKHRAKYCTKQSVKYMLENSDGRSIESFDSNVSPVTL